MIYTVSLGFCPARILEQSLDHLQETRDKSLYNQLVVTDNHYPMNREQNRKELMRIALKHGALFFDSGGDIGAAQSFNQVTNTLPLLDHDYVLGYDPDSWALNPGFDREMSEVLDHYPDLAYVSLTNPDVTFKNPEIVWEHRPRVSVITNRPEMMNVTMFRWSWLKKIGGLEQVCKYYGFMEGKLWRGLSDTSMHSGYLPDYQEDIRLTALHDPEYIEWKSKQVNFHFNGSFKEYLDEQKHR